MTDFWMRAALFCREFGRWKVNNLAVERRNFLGSPLPLAPEFFRNIRLLGRRPTLQQITENLIKKYGTHFLLSATLGGEVNPWKRCVWVWCDCIQTAGHDWLLCKAVVLLPSPSSWAERFALGWTLNYRSRFCLQASWFLLLLVLDLVWLTPCKEL